MPLRRLFRKVRPIELLGQADQSAIRESSFCLKNSSLPENAVAHIGSAIVTVPTSFSLIFGEQLILRRTKYFWLPSACPKRSQLRTPSPQPTRSPPSSESNQHNPAAPTTNRTVKPPQPREGPRESKSDTLVIFAQSKRAARKRKKKKLFRFEAVDLGRAELPRRPYLSETTAARGHGPTNLRGVSVRVFSAPHTPCNQSPASPSSQAGN